MLWSLDKFFEILSTSFLRKSMEISMENLYVDIGVWRDKIKICVSQNLAKLGAGARKKSGMGG